jgi:hypothetical protein
MRRRDRRTIRRPGAVSTRGTAVTRTGLWLVVALITGACGQARHQKVSPWTTHRPDSSAQDAKDFIALTSAIQFIPVTPAHKPTVDSVQFDVDIDPEPAADEFDMTKPNWGDPDFTKDSGRVLAKIVLGSGSSSYPPLQLTNSNYAIRWVETLGSADTSKWTNHYYLIDPSKGTLTEIPPYDTKIPRKFVWKSETTTNTSGADWNKHWDIWPPTGVRPDTIGRGDGFNSSWVSCGAGCCNGR